MSKSILVNCPSCRRKVEWISYNNERPFCSKRCKNNDFIDWANEDKSINGNAIYDDIFSEYQKKD